MGKHWSNISTGLSENLREQTDDKKRKTDKRQVAPKAAGPAGSPRKTPKIIWWHPQTMTSANLGPSSSPNPKQGVVTSNNYVRPIPMTVREKPLKNYRTRTSENWQAKEDSSRRARSRISKEATTNGSMPTGKHHLLSQQQQMTLDFVFTFILATVDLEPNARAF